MPRPLTLPPTDGRYQTVLAFLVQRFPHVSETQWAERMRGGKVMDKHHRPIDAHTRYQSGARILYFREVSEEPIVPFAERIVFQNTEILVADKPHFLPVTPGGDFVEECLLNRLRRRTGIDDLAPMHRLDRETAGLVLFSVNQQTRGFYHELFTRGEVEKTYEALADLASIPGERKWTIENRIERGEPRFRMRVVPGIANARSIIKLLTVRGNRGRFQLHPLTGKTHQLRLHMASLGFGIVNDRVYPELQSERADDFTRPLQLIARQLGFRDPVTGDQVDLESGQAVQE